MSGTKPTNPKDRVAGTKLPAGLVPDTAIIALSLAFAEGAYKYGRFNWRVAGVSASVYMAALRRHIMKWWNGQDADPATRVHHLANAMACCAIVLDAELYGLLNDDRPPAGKDRDAMARAIDEAEATVKHLRELFKDHNPHQPTLHEPVPPPVVPEGTDDGEGWPGLLNPEGDGVFGAEPVVPLPSVDLPRIVDGRPYGATWAIVFKGELVGTHAAYADAEACLDVMLGFPALNTPEELAELEKAQGTVVLVPSEPVDGGELQIHDGLRVIVPPEMRPDACEQLAREYAHAELGADDVPVLFDDDDDTVAAPDEEPLARCGHMNTPAGAVCSLDAGHPDMHSNGVRMWG